MNLQIPLRTARLTLRDFVPGDFDAVHAYASDPDVTRFMFYGPRSAEDTQHYLDRMLASQKDDPRMIELAVVRRLGSPIGACDLRASRRGPISASSSRGVWESATRRRRRERWCMRASSSSA